MAKKHPEYLNSPFVLEGIAERFIDKKGMQLHALEAVDPVSGEAIPLFTPDKKVLVLNDTKQYTKVFADGGAVVRTLSPAAQKLFCYILFHLRANRDTVYLNEDDVCLWAGISASAYRRAVEELLGARVLAKKLGSWLEFFVNPNIAYNGDRVKLMRRLHQRPQ